MENILILKLFYLDKSFIFFLLIIIICGLFNNFFVYFSLLIIHELGHALTGILLGYKIDRIKLFPYGGVTLFKPNYNTPLKKELLVLIMGPLFQVLGYFILKVFVEVDYLKFYHYTLLIFNLLPIYPLDGGKLLNIIFNYHFNYKRSFYMSFYMSIILIILLLIVSFVIKNFNFTMILIVLIIKLIKIYKDLDYVYNSFLLERYLHHYEFKGIRCIKNEKEFYRDNKHIIKMMEENKFLKKYFE